MSGVIFSPADHPMPPVVDDHLRLIMVNGGHGAADAHLSFPYLGVRGDPLPTQLIARDRPATDNMHAAAYFRSTANSVHSIEFVRDVNNGLHVTNAQNMAWTYNFPNGGVAGNGADIVIMPAAQNAYDPPDITTSVAAFRSVFPRDINNTASVEVEMIHGSAHSANPGRVGEVPLYDDAGMFCACYYGTGGNTNPRRYGSVHYLLKTSIVDGSPETSYYDAIQFHTSPENGTVGGFGSYKPLYTTDPDTGAESESVDTWHRRCRLINPTHPDSFTCTRYTNGTTLPAICPPSGNMMTYMRMDMQTTDATSYIAISMPTVGITLPNFNYDSSAPGTRIRVDLEYSMLMCLVDHGSTASGGFIFNDDGYYQKSINTLSWSPSSSQYVLEENIGGFELSAYYYATGLIADIRLKSKTGSSITIGECTMFAESMLKANASELQWEQTNTTTLTNIEVSSSSPTNILRYNQYVLPSTNQTYAHLVIRYGPSRRNRLEIQLWTAGATTLRYRTYLYEA